MATTLAFAASMTRRSGSDALSYSVASLAQKVRELAEILAMHQTIANVALSEI